MSGNGHESPTTGGTGLAGELGSALRRWRERADPAAHGLAPGRGRRTTGLRREELALHAGVSVDYLIRLEQGRATSPSAQVLTALARALRLSVLERRHLFLLAGRFPLPHDRISRDLTPGVRRLLNQLADAPVAVYDPAWTLIAWNRLHARLLGDPSDLPERERNVVWQHFTGRPTRVRRTPDEQVRFEAALVADLRAATARYPADPKLLSLVADLLSASGKFARRWERHLVDAYLAGTKTIDHPATGPVHLDCDVLTVPGSDLRVVVHTTVPGTQSADKLRLLTG